MSLTVIVICIYVKQKGQALSKALLVLVPFWRQEPMVNLLACIYYQLTDGQVNMSGLEETTRSAFWMDYGLEDVDKEKAYY